MRRVVVGPAAVVCASPSSSLCIRDFHSSQILLKKPVSTTSTNTAATPPSRTKSNPQKPPGKKNGRGAAKSSNSAPPTSGGDDDEFDMDRVMETLFKASSANPQNKKDGSSSPMDLLSGMFGSAGENEVDVKPTTAGNKSKKSATSSASVEEMFGNMRALMEEMNLENSRMVNGAQLLQSVPTETESGNQADLPAPIANMIASSKGKVMPASCLPLQVLNVPHIDSTSSIIRINLKDSNRNTPKYPSKKGSPVATLDSYVAPTNLHPTTENFSPLASATAVLEERHTPSVSSLPMEFFNEPCYQAYLQRLVYPHLNNHVNTSSGTKSNLKTKSKGSQRHGEDSDLMAAKLRAEVPAILGRNTFPYHLRGETSWQRSNAAYRLSGSGSSHGAKITDTCVVTAPQPPGSNTLLPSCMIHSTVDWSLPVFHRLQNTILFNEHLRGSSSHTTSRSLSDLLANPNVGGFAHLTPKEAFVLERAFLDMLEMAKSSLPEKLPPRSNTKMGASSVYDGIPAHVLDAVYEFTVRLYFGTVAPARVRSCNTEFTDPRAQRRERLLTPLEACRLLVEPQGESESALQEIDEALAKVDAFPLRHRDSHLSSTSFTLIRERVTIEPESDLTTIDSAIAHVRRMAELSESDSAKRLKDGPFSTLPPEEVRGEDGRLTKDFVDRYTKWMEGEAALKQTSKEERQKLLADPVAVEAMRLSLKERELDQLREKTRALKARSKEQQAQLRAIYKLSPEEVLEKYGTLTPAGSMPVILRKYELSIGQARTSSNNPNPSPTVTSGSSNANGTSSNTGGGLSANARTKTTKVPVYAFFYSTQPELQETNRSPLQQAGEAKIFEVLFGAMLSCVRESVASYRSFGEWPWERPTATSISSADVDAESVPTTASSSSTRGYGDVPYMTDAETTRAESLALPSKTTDDGSSTPLAAHPALAHVFEVITSSGEDDHIGDIYAGIYRSSPSKRHAVPTAAPSVPALKSSREIVQRLRLEDWRSTSGRLVSKKGDVIEQPPVGLHRAYLTFCSAARFSPHGIPLTDGVCLTITDPYCHGAQRAVPPMSQGPSAVVGPPSTSSPTAGDKSKSSPQSGNTSSEAAPPSIASEEWIPEHCALDKAIAQDYKATLDWRDSQRPLPPAFRD